MKKFIQLDVGEYNIGTNSAIAMDNLTIAGTPTSQYSREQQGIFVAGSLISIATNNVGAFDGGAGNGALLKDLTISYNENTSSSKTLGQLFSGSQSYTIIDNCQVAVNMAAFNGFARDSKFSGYVCYGNTTAITPKFFRCSFLKPDSFTYESIGTSYTLDNCYLNAQDLFQSSGSIVVCQLYAYYTHFGPNTDSGNDWYAGGTVITKDGDIQFCMGVPSFATNFTTIGGTYNTDQNYDPLPDF